MPLTIHTKRTNELDITVTKVRTNTPELAATVTVALLDGSTVVSGSNVTLTHQGSGVYYTKYPLLALAKERKYKLRVSVVVAAATVVDNELFSVDSI